MGGATKFIQRGLNALGVKVDVDGGMGPKTLEAISKVHPRALMQATSQAQLDYEYELAYNNSDRKKFIAGLENRIRNRQAIWGVG
jgi:lysozyme family protein